MIKYKMPKKGTHGFRDFKTKREAKAFAKQLKKAGFKPRIKTVVRM